MPDVLVTPSRYLLGWMRGQGWRLPESVSVIPYLTRSVATGEPPPTPVGDEDASRVKRLVFFGRLEERKGLRPFAAALNRLDSGLLDDVELEFIGAPTKGWSSAEVQALLSENARATLRRVSFSTELDQHQALERLKRFGTLAVMPSLEDNSPNTVYECLEAGIPFVASNVGGIAELVAPEDRQRVLFEPTPGGGCQGERP